MTDGTADYNASQYRINVFYDLAKVAVNRLAFSQGHELAPHGATAVAITPGWLRSEMMLENYQVSEDNWRDSIARRRAVTSGAPPASRSPSRPDTSGGRSSRSATDPERARWNQCSVSSGELAAAYGFTDVDGSRPEVWRYMADAERGRAGEPRGVSVTHAHLRYSTTRPPS